MRGVLGLIREHRISIGVNYATLFVNALALDGMAAVLYPTYNVLDAARPLLTLHRQPVRGKGVVGTLLCPLPRPLGKAVFRALVPLMQAAKRRSDRAQQRRVRRG